MTLMRIPIMLVRHVGARRFRMLLLLALLLAGCQSQNPHPPITIGHVSNQSGPNAETAEQSRRAIELALTMINKDDRLAALHVRHTDTQGKLEAFAAEAVRLISVSDAVALLGGRTSAEIEQLDRGLAPVLGLGGMRTPAMSQLVFLTDLAPETRGDVTAKFVVQDLKVTYVLEIIDRREAEANRVSAAFTASIAKLYKRDEPLQHKTVYLSSDADITRAAERVEKTKPDAVVFAGKIETLNEIQRNLAHPVPVVLATAASAEMLQRFPNDIYLISAYAPDDSVASIKEFREKYRDKFAAEPDDASVLTYDAVHLLAHAIRETPEFYRPNKLAETLAGIKDFPGVTGKLSFAGERNLRRPAFILRMGTSIVKRID